MKKILLLVGGAILLVVIAVVSTLAFVRASDPDSAAAEPVAPVEEVEEVEEDIAEDEEADDEEFAEEDEEFESEFSGKDAVYYEFHPSFVVNITDGDRTRYLALDLAVVGYKQSDIDALRVHMPAIRNDLIVLFSSKDASPLRTSEGKEALRQGQKETVLTCLTMSKISVPSQNCQHVRTVLLCPSFHPGNCNQL